MRRYEIRPEAIALPISKSPSLRLFLFAALGFALLLVLAACGGAADDPTPTSPATPEEIREFPERLDAVVPARVQGASTCGSVHLIGKGRGPEHRSEQRVREESDRLDAELDGGRRDLARRRRDPHRGWARHEGAGLFPGVIPGAGDPGRSVTRVVSVKRLSWRETVS